MKNLIEISKIVTKKRISKIEIFDKSLLNKKDSKFNEFYDGLVNNKFRTDDEAADYLYGTNPLDDKYRQLKSRFTKRLLNTLFFLDSNDPSFSNYHSSYYTCNKNWALIRILLSSGARSAATKLASKTITVAQNYRFADVLFNCSRILMTSCSLSGNHKEYEIYSEICHKAMQDMDAEIKSEELYQRLTIHFSSSAAMVNTDLAELGAESLEKSKILCAESDSYNVHYNMYQIWILMYQFMGNYEKMIEICDLAEKFLVDNPPFRQEVKLASLALQKISCYLQLRDYENGRKNAEKCLELFTEGTNNWFVFLEYYFLLAIHTENYINAAGIYLKVVNHPRYEFTAMERQEKWKIFEAYLNYIFETENLNRDFLNDGKRKFRILKFLNEVPNYSKDKRGFNIAILIIQILYMLEKGDYTGIINRSEALNVYCSRYLRKDESYRSNCFIKMLLTMEKEDFRYERSKQLAMKYYRKLTEGNDDGQNIVYEWEIVPYEILWEKVLNRLKNRVNNMRA